MPRSAREVSVRGWPRWKRVVAVVGGGVAALLAFRLAAAMLTERGPESAAPPNSSVVTEAAPPTAVAPTPPLPTVPGSVRALDVLTLFIPQNEHPQGYDRDLFAFGADVVAGAWTSRYGTAMSTDPADVEIDHVVGLEEAWGSGAWAWDEARRAAFGNDLDDARTLRPVADSENRSESGDDPSSWIPALESHVCAHLADWIAIKARWELSMDRSELERIRALITDRCPGLTVAPWPSAPLRSQPPIHVSPLPIWPQPIEAGCDPSYPTVCIPTAPPVLDCSDIAQRRFRVLPSDPHRFDPDRNGVGCER